MRQKKFILQDSEMPTAWFNIQAVMPNKPLPILHPGTKQALKPEDLYPIFCEECSRQELDRENVIAVRDILTALRDGREGS